MSHDRIDLLIDIFDQPKQQASALSTINPPELIKAILQEFRANEFVGDNPAVYQLLKTNGMPLDDALSLDEQLGDNDELHLVERPLSPPAGTRVPSAAIYLREPRFSKVYRLQWLPAIIGRKSKTLEHDEWVAVDLKSYPPEIGERASRRHIQITEHQGQYYVENLSSNNPAFLNGIVPDCELKADVRKNLTHGDEIWLERSGVKFKFLIYARPKPEPTI